MNNEEPAMRTGSYKFLVEGTVGPERLCVRGRQKARRRGKQREVRSPAVRTQKPTGHSEQLEFYSIAGEGF